jgi:hypothetical protein
MLSIHMVSVGGDCLIPHFSWDLYGPKKNYKITKVRKVSPGIQALYQKVDLSQQEAHSFGKQTQGADSFSQPGGS